MSTHILVIDDECAARELCEAAMEDSDYSVSTASSGKEGIESAREHHPDLIFLDLMMPMMNGIETLGCMRAFLPDTPVYIVTAFDRSLSGLISEERANELAFEVCCKPVSAVQLRQIADGVLLGSAQADVEVLTSAGKSSETLDLRLYVAGQTTNSIRAQENIKNTLKAWGGHYHLEILDVIKHPHGASSDGVVATPTLLKLHPSPCCRLIGRFTDQERLMQSLGLSDI